MKLIALGNVLYAVWDAFNDPIAGYLSDRTRTRWGRRKPRLLVSVPVFVLSSILFFSPPASPGTGVGLAVYFTVFLMLTETGNTISTVNYHSLLPELYRDESAATRANALRQAMQLVGMIIGVSLVPMITAAIGYRATALALGLLSGALILYSILGCRERSEFSQSEQPGLLASLKALATNANFWLVSVSPLFLPVHQRAVAGGHSVLHQVRAAAAGQQRHISLRGRVRQRHPLDVPLVPPYQPAGHA